MADGLDVVFDRHMPDRTGKYIVFCSNAEHMREMMELSRSWFHRIDTDPHIYSLYASDPSAGKSFADFKADDDASHLKLLYCIDALNEGIHLEDISGVILLRPTVSPIVFKQQIGRALSAGKKTDAVIFDIVLNINNLYSIGALEEEMQTAAAYYRSLGEDSEIVQEHFRIIDEVQDCRELFDRLGEVLTTSWSVMYEQAKRYYMENGDLEVPARYVTADGYSLGHWVYNQRNIRKGLLDGSLTEEKIAKLDAVGMRWDKLDHLWERNYRSACAYYKEHRNLSVPSSYVDAQGIRLGAWISRMRKLRNAADDHVPGQREQKSGKPLLEPCEDREQMAGQKRERLLTQEQIERLDRIGMIWRPRTDQAWEKGFAAAQDYAKACGNLLVPSAYVGAGGVKLGSWIQRQRMLYKKGTLEPCRIKRLENIGMVWDTQPWMVRFHLAQQYYRENGTLDIPQSEVADGCWLGKWIVMQKKLYDERRLTREQQALLSSLPLEQVGNKDARWRRMYRDAAAYYREHGNLKVPQGYVGNSGCRLADWLIRQRRSRKLGELSEEKIRLLDELGFQWDIGASRREGHVSAGQKQMDKLQRGDP